MSPDELQRLANSCGRGHMKYWKAASMLWTMRDLELARDKSRLRRWVANCLEMEGFDAAGIDAVTNALAAKTE